MTLVWGRLVRSSRGSLRAPAVAYCQFVLHMLGIHPWPALSARVLAGGLGCRRLQRTPVIGAQPGAKVMPRRALCPCGFQVFLLCDRDESTGTTEKADEMSMLLRRDPRTVFPDLIEWFEEPFLTLRPYLAQPIRVEDYLEDDHYMVRAELRLPNDSQISDGLNRNRSAADTTVTSTSSPSSCLTPGPR